jgi:hypothetical protein
MSPLGSLPNIFELFQLAELNSASEFIIFVSPSGIALNSARSWTDSDSRERARVLFPAVNGLRQSRGEPLLPALVCTAATKTETSPRLVLSMEFDFVADCQTRVSVVTGLVAIAGKSSVLQSSGVVTLRYRTPVY